MCARHSCRTRVKRVKGPPDIILVVAQSGDVEGSQFKQKNAAGSRGSTKGPLGKVADPQILQRAGD